MDDLAHSALARSVPSETEGGRLRHQRIDFASAADFVLNHHRHHIPPVGHVFSLGAFLGDRMVGVAIVGRPVARHRDDGLTAEITRLCVLEGVRNAASFLLGKATRAAMALGFRRIGTYTLGSESGTSLRAAGWRCVGEVKGRSWSCPSRTRTDKHPTSDKLLWEAITDPSAVSAGMEPLQGRNEQKTSTHKEAGEDE